MGEIFVEWLGRRRVSVSSLLLLLAADDTDERHRLHGDSNPTAILPLLLLRHLNALSVRAIIVLLD